MLSWTKSGRELSLIKFIIIPGTCNLNATQFACTQTVKYGLSAQQKSFIELFTGDDILHEPADLKFYKNEVYYKILQDRKSKDKTSKRLKKKIKMFNIQIEKALME